MKNNCPELSFPSKIYRGFGSINRIHDISKKLGQRLFIIGGNKALKATMPLLESQLADLEIVVEAWYGGECSQTNVDKLLKQVNKEDIDFIVGIGGGKALDTSKLVAQALDLPLLTIPTIAATCAAVAAASIVYDDKGHYLDFCLLKQAPDFVIMDPQIIAQAPVKWLSAGLADTLAKFYEFSAVSETNPESSLNMSAYNNGQLCFDVISRYGPDAIQGVNNDQTSFALEQVMDAIFIYAGFTSIMGVGNHVAAAHGLYNGFTVNDKTRHFGHGLLVGYGNLCLLALENKEDQHILDAIQLAKNCAVPVSLSEIADLSNDELLEIADAAVATSDIQSMPFPVTSQDLILAIKRIENLVLNFK